MLGPRFSTQIPILPVLCLDRMRVLLRPHSRLAVEVAGLEPDAPPLDLFSFPAHYPPAGNFQIGAISQEAGWDPNDVHELEGETEAQSPSAYGFQGPQ